jgi:hypothetical protein
MSRSVSRRPLRATAGATGALPADPDLALITAAWSSLPAPVKAGMVALVKAAAKES